MTQMYGKLELKDYNLQFRKYIFHKVENKDFLQHCSQLLAVGILCNLLGAKEGECDQIIANMMPFYTFTLVSPALNVITGLKGHGQRLSASYWRYGLVEACWQLLVATSRGRIATYSHSQLLK